MLLSRGLRLWPAVLHPKVHWLRTLGISSSPSSLVTSSRCSLFNLGSQLFQPLDHRWTSGALGSDFKRYSGDSSSTTTPTELSSASGTSSSSSSSSHFLFSEDEDTVFIRNHPAYRTLFYFHDLRRVDEETKHIAAKEFLAITNPDEVIYHKKYTPAIQTLVAALQDLSENELQHVLYHMAEFPSPRRFNNNPEFFQVWKHFDDECIRRALLRKKWAADVNYVYVDLWSRMRLTRMSTYHWLFVKVGIRKIDHLPRSKFIRVCQGICKAKKLPKEIKLFNIEYNIPRIIKECKGSEHGSITTTELSPMCCLFWKTRSSFHDSSIVNDILAVCLENTTTISSSSLAAICRSIGLSIKINVHESLTKFLEKMIPEVSRLNIRACAALLYMSKRHRLRNPQLLSELAIRIEKERGVNVGNFVPVDVENIVSAYEVLDPSSTIFQTVYNILVESAKLSKAKAIRQETLLKVHGSEEHEEDDEDGNEEDDRLMTNPFKKKVDNLKPMSYRHLPIEEVIIRMYGRRLVSILNSLSYGNVFPEKLIAHVLSPGFLHEYYGKSMHTYHSDILLLNQDVLNRSRGYVGPRLSEKAVGFLTKSIMLWVSPPDKMKVSRYESMCRSVAQVVSNVFENHDFLYLCNIIPHYCSIEIVMCTNKHNELLPVPEEYRALPPHEIKLLDEPTTGKLQYHALLLHNWDMLIGGTDEPIGPRKRAKQEIQDLGYKTYEISQNSWTKLETEEERQSYILTLLKVGGMKLSPDETE